MPILAPRIVHEGTNAKLMHNGRQIGTIGAWKVCLWGDERPYLTASGCKIPAVWCSAGLEAVTVVGRPLSRSRLQAREITITGKVARIGRDVLSLGDLTIEGAASGKVRS